MSATAPATATAPAIPTALTTELDAAAGLLAEFDLGSLAHTSDEDVCLVVGAVEALARRVAAIQVMVAGEVAERSRRELGVAGLAQKHGCVRPAALLELVARVSGAEAARRIQLGTALRASVTLTGEKLPPRCPGLAAAVADGTVGAESATVILRALDDVRRVAHPDDLDAAEAGLVEHARVNPVQYVTDLALVVRDRLDPDGILPREEETRARRGITLGRERNGVIPIRGALGPIPAALLKSVFDEANAPGAKPRFLTDDDLRDGTVTSTDADGNEVITLRDTRTREQRQHDVLEGLIKAGIRNTGHEPGQLRSLAEITAHITLADLENDTGTEGGTSTGVGYIDGIQHPVSVNTIQRLACDSAFRRVVLGNDGEILALGKTRYRFTPAQRKAIIARDGDRCVLCDAPVTWADTHHVEEYFTHGATGETDVHNGVMLCGPHHDFIHRSNWQIAMINHIPHLLAPPEIDPTQTWKRLGKQRIHHRQTG